MLKFVLNSCSPQALTSTSKSVLDRFFIIQNYKYSMVRYALKWGKIYSTVTPPEVFSIPVYPEVLNSSCTTSTYQHCGNEIFIVTVDVAERPQSKLAPIIT